MKKHPRPTSCAKCGASDVRLNPCEGGHICDECVSQYHEGRDESTKAIKSLKKQVLEETPLITPSAGVKPMQVGTDPSATPGLGLVDNPQNPDQTALDASAYRAGLLTGMGNDCVAMAVDAATSIKAENSLEKMLAHQLAMAHKSALEVTNKAFFEEDATEKAKLLNLAARMMDTFQRGLLTFQRLKTGGEQRVTVHHVTVAEGGQAIVGNVRGGDKPK